MDVIKRFDGSLMKKRGAPSAVPVMPSQLNVNVTSIPAKDWWERFPVSVGISLLAFFFSIVPFAYSTWPARETAAVAIVRWITPFTSDGAMHPEVWLAVANRGNRDIVILQSPFMYQSSPEAMAFADETPLTRQSDPTVVEPGKSAVIRVSTDILPETIDKARMPPDQERSDEKGSKAVIKLAVNVIVAHPGSGRFSNAITNCLRVMLYQASPLRSEVDPNFTELRVVTPGQKEATAGSYPCLNDSPAPNVTR